MRIFINERLHELKETSSLAEAIEHLDIPRQGLAVAVNSAVVPQEAWSSCILQEDDKVMVIRAAQGG